MFLHFLFFSIVIAALIATVCWRLVSRWLGDGDPLEESERVEDDIRSYGELLQASRAKGEE